MSSNQTTKMFKNLYKTPLKSVVRIKNYSSKTSGAIIIADEILTGKTKDINAHFLSKRKIKKNKI